MTEDKVESRTELANFIALRLPDTRDLYRGDRAELAKLIAELLERARPSVPEQGQGELVKFAEFVRDYFSDSHAKFENKYPECESLSSEGMAERMRISADAALAASRSEAEPPQESDETPYDFAIENFLNRDFEVNMAETDYPTEWPADEMCEKPVARIRWFEDRGDSSVGLQGWSGFCLTPDQSGTWLEKKLAGAPAAGSAEREK